MKSEVEVQCGLTKNVILVMLKSALAKGGTHGKQNNKLDWRQVEGLARRPKQLREVVRAEGGGNAMANDKRGQKAKGAVLSM